MLRSSWTQPPYLGVAESVTGRRWQGLSPGQDRLSLQIAQHCGVPSVLARALARRNLKPWDVAAYLDPQPIDPNAAGQDLMDLERAADRLVDAIRRHEAIAIVADTGIDGCCAMVMMQIAMQACMANPEQLTVRFVSKPAASYPIAELLDTHNLIVLLDLGDTPLDPDHKPRANDILVIDNDARNPEGPAAPAHVNGNRHDESGHYADLCTAGLTNLLLEAIHTRLHAMGSPTFDRTTLAQYVCMACAAERVSLHANNRPFILPGLAQIRQRTHPGFSALMDAIPLRHKLRFHDLRSGFAARMAHGEYPGHSPLTYQLLSATHPADASSPAAVLDQFHEDRAPAREQSIIEACDLASGRKAAKGMVWAASHNWACHHLEAIAAALQERFNWPGLAIRLDSPVSSAVGVGVPGFNLGVAIANCKMRGLAINGGGHPMKAVLAMPPGGILTVLEALSAELHHQNPMHKSCQDVRLDGILKPEAVNYRLMKTIDRIGPFGIGSPRPRFVLTHQHILKRRKYGTESLRLELSGNDNGSLNGFVPGGYQSELGMFLRHCSHAPVHLAGTVSMAGHGGRQTRFNIEDAAKI